eukprot:gene31071-40409_t
MSKKSKNQYSSRELVERNGRSNSNKKRKQSFSKKAAKLLNPDIPNKIEEGLQLQRAKAKLAVESLKKSNASSISDQSIDLSNREGKESVIPRVYTSNLLRALRMREIGYSSGTTSILKRWNSFHSIILSERLSNIHHCWVDASEQIIDLSYRENRGVIFCDKNRLYFLGRSHDSLWTQQSLTPGRPLNFEYSSVYGLSSSFSHYNTVLWSEGVDSHTFAALSRCRRVNGQFSWLSLFDSTRMHTNTNTNTPATVVNPRIADMDFQSNTIDTGQEAICWCGKSGNLLSCGQAGIVAHHFDGRKSVYQLSTRAINAAVSASTSNLYSYNDAACKCLPVCMAWASERDVLLFGLRSGGILMADGRLDGRRHSSGSCSLLGSLPFRVDHLQSLDAQGSILASDVVGSLQLFDMRVIPCSGKPKSGRVVRECNGNSTSSIRPTDTKGRFYVAKDRRAVLLPAPPSHTSPFSLSPFKNNLLAYSLMEENTPLQLNISMEVCSDNTTIASSSFFNFGSSDSSDVIVGFVNPPSRLQSGSSISSITSNLSPYSMIFKSPPLL